MTQVWRGSAERAAGRRTRGELRGRRTRRLMRDTYTDGDSEVDQRVRILAAACYAGPTAVVTGWSACVLLGLDVAPGERPVELSVVDRRIKRTDIHVRRQRIPSEDIVEIEGVWVTSALRTAFDLATRTPLADAVVAADALGAVGMFEGGALRDFAARHRGFRGLRGVEAVAALMDPRAESPPETRTRLVLVQGGLGPVAQYRVRREDGWVIGRVDLALPEFRVAVEYDGRHHAEEDRRGRDIDRIDEMEREGWVVVVVTARQLRRPQRLVARVREAIAEQVARQAR